MTSRASTAKHRLGAVVPSCAYVFTLCMRSKAWLAPSVWLRLARLPPPASSMRRSRRLRDKLAAAPGLLAHAWVTEVVKFCPISQKLRHTGVEKRHGRIQACHDVRHADSSYKEGHYEWKRKKLSLPNNTIKFGAAYFMADHLHDWRLEARRSSVLRHTRQMH
jgi:hypothetical protein